MMVQYVYQKLQNAIQRGETVVRLTGNDVVEMQKSSGQLGISIPEGTTAVRFERTPGKGLFGGWEVYTEAQS